MDFKNKNVLITGAGGAIGKGIAIDFCKNKGNVFITDLNKDTIDKAVKKISGYGACNGLAGDVTIEDDVKMVLKAAQNAFSSKIDILINAAGIVAQALVEDITVEEWDRVFAVNCRGTFLFCKYCVPLMKKKKAGKIINFSSKSGKTGSALMSHYSAAKAAIIGFTQSLASELAEYNINVNCVCPGITDNTGVWKNVSAGYIDNLNLSRDEVVKMFSAKIPLKRLASIKNIVDVVIFLSSEESDYMTGQAINITGGREMH